MASDTAAALQQELGSALTCLERLDEGQRQQLLALIREVRTRQKQRVEEQLNHALEFIPALLRGVVKRLFGL